MIYLAWFIDRDHRLDFQLQALWLDRVRPAQLPEKALGRVSSCADAGAALAQHRGVSMYLKVQVAETSVVAVVANAVVAAQQSLRIDRALDLHQPRVLGLAAPVGDPPVRLEVITFVHVAAGVGSERS